MPPKKDAGAAAGGGAPDLKVELDKAFALATVSGAAFSDKLQEGETEAQRLRTQVRGLQLALTSSEDTEKATYAHAEAQLRRKDAELAAAKARLEALEEKVARFPLDLKGKLEANTKLWEGELSRTKERLRERELALEKLADFRAERDTLIQDLDDTRAALEKEKEAHSFDVTMLQRANANDREHVRALLLERLKEAKAGIMSQAAGAMSENVKRIVAENDAMLHELAYQSKQAERLAGLVDSLTEENTTARRDLSIAEGELREVFRRVSAMAGALRHAREQLRLAHDVEVNRQDTAKEEAERARAAAAADASRAKREAQALARGSPSALARAAATAGGAGEAAVTLSFETDGAGPVATPVASASSSKPRQWIKTEAVRLPGKHALHPHPPQHAGAHSVGRASRAEEAGEPQQEHEEGTAGEGHFLDRVDRAAFDAALDVIVTMDTQRAEMLSVADDTTAALLRAATSVRGHISRLAGGAQHAAALASDAEADAVEAAAMGTPDAVLFMDAAAALERLLSPSSGDGRGRDGGAGRQGGGGAPALTPGGERLPAHFSSAAVRGAALSSGVGTASSGMGGGRAVAGGGSGTAQSGGYGQQQTPAHAVHSAGGVHSRKSGGGEGKEADLGLAMRVGGVSRQGGHAPLPSSARSGRTNGTPGTQGTGGHMTAMTGVSSVFEEEGVGARGEGRKGQRLPTPTPGGVKDVLAVYAFLHFLGRRMQSVLSDMQRSVPQPLTVEQLIAEGLGEEEWERGGGAGRHHHHHRKAGGGRPAGFSKAGEKERLGEALRAKAQGQ